MTKVIVDVKVTYFKIKGRKCWTSESSGLNVIFFLWIYVVPSKEMGFPPTNPTNSTIPTQIQNNKNSQHIDNSPYNKTKSYLFSESFARSARPRSYFHWRLGSERAKPRVTEWQRVASTRWVAWCPIEPEWRGLSSPFRAFGGRRTWWIRRIRHLAKCYWKRSLRLSWCSAHLSSKKLARRTASPSCKCSGPSVSSTTSMVSTHLSLSHWYMCNYMLGFLRVNHSGNWDFYVSF